MFSICYMIQVEPVIQANHEGIVHHIVLYACNNDVAPYINSTESFACDFPNRSKNIPDEIRRCRGRHVFTAWAVGGPVSRMTTNRVLFVTNSLQLLLLLV